MVDNFCCDEFWNLNETWDTQVPDFSSCFQDIVLVFIPSIIFSIAGIINLCVVSRYNSTLVPLPCTWRIIFKLFLAIVLFLISATWCSLYVYKKLSDGSDTIPISTLAASVARSVTFVIIIAQMLQHRSHGIGTSSVISIFWFCFALFGVIMHRSVILKNSEKPISPSWSYMLSMLYYPIIYIQFIMSFFTDTKAYSSLGRSHPMDEASFISGIFYLWYYKTVYLGIKRLLTVSDFLPLPVKLQASYVYQVFAKNWNFNFLEFESQKNKSLVAALTKSFFLPFLLGFLLNIFYVLFLLIPPLILDQILAFVKDDHYSWRMYYYCGAILIVSFTSMTLHNNYLMYLLITANQVKSALISAIYRKNLVLASSTRKSFTSGAISNLVSVDVIRISWFAIYASIMISSPFRIILIMFFMWEYLGAASFAGVAVIVILIPISFCISRVSEKYTERQMAFKDSRLKCINEIINGIKILKFYAWEVPFSSKIYETRKKEIRLIRLSQICYIVTSFVFSCAPILVSLATFSTFLLVNSHHILSPTIAFVSLNLLEQLRFALFTIPDSLSELVQTIASLKRIHTFLIAEETDVAVTGESPDEGDAITFKNATISWLKDESGFSLKDINLKIPIGQLVAVIGPVGAGKSSLLSAILGDMYKSSGSIDVKGTFAYVPQEAWILNRTVKGNILLEKPMQEDKYNNILDCCCLQPDLKILAAKDETEIGEKGINLSGGQKQRVSVARAVFQNQEIYLLDDPLSAVDAHVRKSLFENVIGNQGLLSNKTRILVTHDIAVLSDVDVIVRMDEGKILEIGTYKELLDSSESFLSFINTHSAVDENESVDSPELNCKDDKLMGQRKRTISEDSDSKKNDITGGTLVEEEVMEIGKVKRGIFLNYVKHVTWPIFLLAVFGFTAYTTFEALCNVWVSKWTADPVQNATQDSSQTIYRLSVYGGLGFAEALMVLFATAALVYGSTKCSEAYHNEMLSSLLKSPMSFFDVTPMGRIVNRFSTDIDTLDVQIIYDIDGWLSCVLYCLATLIIIGINTPFFLVAILPMGVLYYIILWLHLNTSRQVRRLESVTKSPLYSHLLESVYGVISIKAFKVEKQFIEKNEENLDNHLSCYFSTISSNRWLHFSLDVISCSLILFATWLAIDKRHELGASVVGLIILYILNVTDSLMWLVRTNNELENKCVAIERVSEYCHLPSEAPWEQPDHDPALSWPEDGEIVFDNYSTRYRENLDLVLKNVNLNVTANEKVGIVGRTGAGKSSITLSMFRIIEPATGTILIDNVDLSKIGLHALRLKLTIIPQDPVLFTGTLRFNLDPNDEYGDEDIWDSLSNAHLKDFVSTLAEGLQHNVEEGGKNLSAGQKQLLCLARALLKKSKVLILDEATAAVDMDTDKLVQDTIRTAFANHTVISIAHRLNTVMDYDKIVVMDSGEVAEVGSPADLLQNKESRFYELAKEAKLV